MELSKTYAIGLDLGGTKILTALIKNTGDITDRVVLNTPSNQGDQAIRDQIVASIQMLLDKTGVSHEQILGVGVGTAGVIDSRQSVIVQATNLGLNNAPIGSWIKDAFGFAVRIGNDANVAAVGEWLFGAGKGHQDVIYVTVSTGIGAGIISGGHLIKGTSDSAGEFGHISIEPEGPLCPCGNRGCLELYASGTALGKRVERMLEAGEKSPFLEEQTAPLTSKEIAQAAAAGDPLALRAFEETGYYLGIGLTSMIHIFNPELIICGGGVMNAGDYLLPAVEKIIQDRCISTMRKQVRIVKSSLGPEAGILGAAGLIFAGE